MARLAACGLLIFLATITAAWAEGPSVTVADPYLELRSGRGAVSRSSTSSSAARACVVERGAPTGSRSWTPTRREGWVHRSQMTETLLPAGVKLEIDDPSREDFGTHRREAGLLLGDYGGANVVTVYGAYAFNEHLAAELALAHILGNFSDGQYATIGVTHVPVPEWRIQPFLSIGTGVIRIRPEGTLVGSEDRTDQVAYAGAGVRLTSRGASSCAAKSRNTWSSPDRDENEEDVEWKIGFAFFF